jgi:hypothetical protein
MGRNAEGVFANLIDLAAPVAFLGHIPVAVLHDPQSSRDYRAIPAFRISELLICLISALPKTPTPGFRELLRSVGRGLLDISRLTDWEFNEFALRAVRNVESQRLQYLEHSLLEFSACPPHWQNETQELHKIIVGRLLHPDLSVPVEFKHKMKIGPARQRTKEIVRNAGELFQLWPDLIDAARHLKSQGIRISKALEG